MTEHERNLERLRQLAEAKRGRLSAVERVRAKFPDYHPPAHELAAVRAFAVAQRG